MGFQIRKRKENNHIQTKTMKQKNKGLFIITLFLSTITHGQLTKGNWLVGGNANFSSSNGETISNGGTQKSTYIDIS